MGEHTETPNLSRWQQLYGSASINEKSRNELSIQKIQESFEDSESVNEWFDDLNFKLKDQDDLVFEIKNPIQLVSSKDEDEAEKILDDLEDMIREHDYDLMESILESDRHQQAIAQFRNEENARNCLRQWKNYTKGRIVKLQFAASVIQDKRFHYIKSKSFNKWLESLRESSAFTNDFKQLQQQKLLRNILRVWAEEIKQQVKASQTEFETILKRNVIRRWKKSTDHEPAYQSARHHYQKYQLQSCIRRWKSMHFLSIEARINSEKYHQHERENEEILHNHRVAKLFHFLETKEVPNLFLPDEKENVYNAVDTKTAQLIEAKDIHESAMKEQNRAKRVARSHMKRNEYEIKRRALKDKHIKSKRENEKRVARSKACKDDEERRAYLRKKREEKIMKKMKEEAIEMAKRAQKLAKLHYSLTLLRSTVNKWRSYVNERRLMSIKAIKYHDGSLIHKCFYGLHEYIREKLINEERQRFQNADKYHELRLCESVLLCWSNLSSNSHDILYTRVTRMKLLYRQGRLLSKWKAKYLLQRVQSIKRENLAMKLAHKNKMKWVMRKFRLGVDRAMHDRKEDELVAQKLEQLKSWLDS